MHQPSGNKPRTSLYSETPCQHVNHSCGRLKVGRFTRRYQVNRQLHILVDETSFHKDLPNSVHLALFIGQLVCRLQNCSGHSMPNSQYLHQLNCEKGRRISAAAVAGEHAGGLDRGSTKLCQPEKGGKLLPQARLITQQGQARG